MEEGGTAQEQGAAVTLVELVAKLGKLDRSLMQIRAESRELVEQQKRKHAVILGLQSKIKELDQQVALRRERFDKAASVLKHERDQLVDRRKALGAINDYKTQLAAQREIEHASRLIDAREETLLKSLDDLAPLESEREKKVAELKEREDELRSSLQANRESFERYKERELEKVNEREGLVASLDPESHRLYERVHSKFLADPVVEITDKKACSACFVQIGPQVIVQLIKKDKLIQCPGCKRILFLGETAE